MSSTSTGGGSRELQAIPRPICRTGLTPLMVIGSTTIMGCRPTLFRADHSRQTGAAGYRRIERGSARGPLITRQKPAIITGSAPHPRSWSLVIGQAEVRKDVDRRDRADRGHQDVSAEARAADGGAPFSL